LIAYHSALRTNLSQSDEFAFELACRQHQQPLLYRQAWVNRQIKFRFQHLTGLLSTPTVPVIDCYSGRSSDVECELMGTTFPATLASHTVTVNRHTSVLVNCQTMLQTIAQNFHAMDLMLNYHLMPEVFLLLFWNCSLRKFISLLLKYGDFEFKKTMSLWKESQLYGQGCQTYDNYRTCTTMHVRYYNNQCNWKN